MEPSSIKSLNVRTVQNFLLVWLDANIDEADNEDCHNFLIKLRQIVNNINTFTDVDKCTDFINDIKEEKTFMISSGVLGQTIVPVVHDKPQVNTIYIFCGNKARHEKWAHQWPKIKGIFTDIIPVCEALKKETQDCDQNSVSISVLKTTDGASSQNLNELDQSFMYTQILKEILLTIDFEQKHIHEFLTYCREQFANNTFELSNIDKLEKEYCRHPPIWWYTYECFLYSTLNRALRTMEVDLIIKMGFFVRNLHEHIAVLHAVQYAGQNCSNSFTVYRGQGFSQSDSDRLMTAEGGLLSFNNFLSTSKDHDVSFDFARRTMVTSSLVGVLFVMTIDPSISSTPFANIRDVSAYQTEEEILFSMHSIFRIGQIKQIDKNNRLWQVDLTLTSDNDPQLHTLTERVREEIKGSSGWLRLGKLMVRLAEYNKAEGLYGILLAQATDETEKGDIYYQLGCVMLGRGEYTRAITLYEQSLQFREKNLTSQHPDVAECYNDIGVVYHGMGEYSKALSYYEKALEIRQSTLDINHPDVAESYNNMGLVYDNMGEYSKALSSHEKALEIKQKTLPSNHPHLATSHNNIGLVYYNMEEYSKALSSHKKALKIRQKTLPPNHPNLAISYNNIGSIYDSMNEYSEALSYYEKVLAIYQKALPPDHPDLAGPYNNIGSVYNNMGDYPKALSFHEKALEIRQKNLQPYHPDLATSCAWHGYLYDNMDDYAKALTFYERAVDIGQCSLPADHPDVQQWKSSLECIKKKL